MRDVDPVDTLRGSLPLKIDVVEAVTDPVLTIGGEGWWLTIVCPWFIEGEALSTSWLSERYEDEVWDLVGHSIVSFEAGPDLVDPIFQLTGGLELKITADSDLDPWSLRLPDMVFVGSKSV